jgi:hypothetical protein
MWLKDFFSEVFPSCRTMTYGYNADLERKSVHTILDYCRKFLSELQSIRKSEEVCTIPKKRDPIIVPTKDRKQEDRLSFLDTAMVA